MKKSLAIIALALGTSSAFAQTGNVGIGTKTPHPSALLELNGTNKGFLINKMTAAQRDAIENPAQGLLVFVVDDNVFYYFKDELSGWQALNKFQANSMMTGADNLGNHIAEQTLNMDGNLINSNDAANQGLLLQDGGSLSVSGISGAVYPSRSSKYAMMFIPNNRGAFRVGEVTNDNWDDAKVGIWSVGMGYNALAKGQAATSIGRENIAGGDHAVAIGRGNNAASHNTVAIGDRNTASILGAVAIGSQNKAKSYGSVALGLINEASHTSFAAGTENVSGGTGATAIGRGNIAKGNHSIAIGDRNETKFTTGIAMGNQNKALGYFGMAIGDQNNATGNQTAAFGYSNAASYDKSMAIGHNSNSSRRFAYTYGNGLNANLYSTTVFGSYNAHIGGNIYSWSANDPLVVFGNGQDESTRSNAMVISKGGNVGIGVNKPQEALEIVGSVKIQDGSQGAGKVLVSDADGKGTWEVIPGSGPDMDEQTLSLVGNDLTISNGNTITLPSPTASGDNLGNHTAEQTLNMAGNLINSDAAANQGLLMQNGGSMSISGVSNAAFPTRSSKYAMMFIPNKRGAIRAGEALGDDWDESNVGIWSIALGYDQKATGQGGIALGQQNDAIGDEAIAIGQGNKSNSHNTTTIGLRNTAKLGGGVAIGRDNTAESWGAVALGSGNVSRHTSLAAGGNNTASGTGSTSIGNGNVASGNHSTAIGKNNVANFATSIAMGNANIAKSYYSMAIGDQNFAGANHCAAFGYENTASYDKSMALGHFNKSTRRFAYTYGVGLNADLYSTSVFGSYNEAITGNIFNWSANDPLVVFGNGQNEDTRSNAMVISKGGNVGIGINKPTHQLTVVGGKVRIADGSEAAGYVLVSDADGVATWMPMPTTTAAQAPTVASEELIQKMMERINSLEAKILELEADQASK